MFRNINSSGTFLRKVFASTSFAQSLTIRTLSSPAYVTTKFVTKILNEDNQETAFQIDHQNNDSIQHRIYLRKSSDGSALGFMRYFAWEDHIYIFDMKNRAPGKHKNVGAFLHEYAFRDSVHLGKKGNVRLYAVGTSHYFHFLMGFRPYPVQTLTFNMDELPELKLPREKYLRNPEDKTAEAEVLAIIHAKDLVAELKANTQAALQVGPDIRVSLQQIMRHGFFKSRDISREWEEKFAVLPNSPRKDTSSWGGHDMHVPAATIQQKMKTLGLTLPTPELAQQKKPSL